ncbi:MAG: pumilio domain member 6 [Bogoriella megaspora]|nr:MAG: pumilio domain member 6 [Bogoriella megaspora]
MPGIKRKQFEEPKKGPGNELRKKPKMIGNGANPLIKGRKPPSNVSGSKSKRQKLAEAKKLGGSDDLVESDTTEDDDSFGDPSGGEDGSADADVEDVDENGGASLAAEISKSANGIGKNVPQISSDGKSSKEVHAKQKQLAKERKLAKPNADITQRAKKLWERLRRKSHVPKDERKNLVSELFDIITGRVKDFVFKHDSVRVIECALKYANMEQRKIITKELLGEYKNLAESRYAKFLIGKLLVEGDNEIRDLIIPEFYGHVRRLINHPEASWIVDDIYRQKATNAQKSILLCEWYGAEFAIANKALTSTSSSPPPTSDLPTILSSSPEKRKPILTYLFTFINTLVQKRTTGFTMLHDAMLQYYLCIPHNSTSPEHTAFLDLLRPESSSTNNDSAPSTDGSTDLLLNLAFTPSGSHLLTLLLSHTPARDRKLLLRAYKSHIPLLASDPHAHIVLLAALSVVDDTKALSKTILPELLGTKLETAPNSKDDEVPESVTQAVVTLVNDINARSLVLLPLAGGTPQKSFLSPKVQRVLEDEVFEKRKESSKKDPVVRAKELAEYMLPVLLKTIERHARELTGTGFGAQFISAVLLSPHGALEPRVRAAKAVAELVDGNVRDEQHVFHDGKPWAGRCLKGLVTGGLFDAESKVVRKCEGWEEVRFPRLVWEKLKSGGDVEENLVRWATGGSSFVVVNLLDVEEGDGGLGAAERGEVIGCLEKGRSEIESAANGGEGKKGKGNVGAKMLLEKIG